MRTRILLLAVVLGLSNSAAAQMIPSGCDSIAAVPARYAIDYQNDIQAIFSFRCANCHVDHGGNPDSDLDLDPDPSWFNLVGVPSNQAPAQIRVVPNDAVRSLLFAKLNCEVPGPVPGSDRMPRFRLPLPIAEQALIYDWIMAGAPIDATDTIFFGGFEQRGLVP